MNKNINKYLIEIETYNPAAMTDGVMVHIICKETKQRRGTLYDVKTYELIEKINSCIADKEEEENAND